jgi:hydrogenase expression/formation protein HypE
MMGARPLYLSLALILEEGLPIADLERIVDSIKQAAVEAGVSIVPGDTKVVQRGSADGIFINTAGIGRIPQGLDISGANARPGDAVILSGSVGDHGMTVMSQREGLRFSGELYSDCAPLNGLVAEMLYACSEVHVLRDPTRGGVATTLNEIARQSNVGINIDEDKIPIKPPVASLCELLGLDPLYVANEGKLLAFTPADKTDNLLAVMRRQQYGRDAAIIGRVIAEHPGRVTLRTSLGTSRVITMMAGDLLPRIC